jgi:hypothetical protein
MTKDRVKSLAISDLTSDEVGSYFEKFGESYWNDTEGFVCVPVAQIMNNHYLMSKYNMFFGIFIEDLDFLIIDVNVDQSEK